MSQLANLVRDPKGSTLTVRQLAVLAEAARDPKMCLTEVAAHLQIGKPAVSRCVTTLEEEGLLERRTQADDRRLIRVAVTESGTRILALLDVAKA